MGMWNVEKRITEIKYTRNILFPEARKIVEQTQKQPSYAYVTKKGNEEKEDTKPEQEELNKLTNELKKSNRNTKNDHKRDYQGRHFNSSRQIWHTTKIRKKNLSKEKEKSKLNKKPLINEPITLSNRFSPMDIDPVKQP